MMQKAKKVNESPHKALKTDIWYRFSLVNAMHPINSVPITNPGSNAGLTSK
jgi:hypothetical protein